MKTVSIAFVNQKGGVGKTTASTMLSAGLALRGFKVCLVDVDGQCNSSMALGADPEDIKRQKALSVLDIFLNKKPAAVIARPVREDFFAGKLFVVPGHPAMDAVHPKLEADLKAETLTDGLSPEDEDDRRTDHRDRFKHSLESLNDSFDFVIVDTPPSLGFQLSSALRAVDWFCIPMLPSSFELKGMQRVIGTAQKIRKRANPKLSLLSVLITQYDRRTRLDADIYSDMHKNLGDRLSKVKITASVRLRESYSRQGTIFEHPLGAQLAAEYMAFVDEVCEKVGVASEPDLKDEVLIPFVPPAKDQLDTTTPTESTEAVNG